MSSETPPATKGKKIKQVFKLAARLRRALKAGRGNERNDFSRPPGSHLSLSSRCKSLDVSIYWRRIEVARATRTFVVVSVLNTRHQTPVIKRTLNPVYTPKDATFEFPIYLSLADRLGVVEFIVWDKDMLKKDYLGEVSFSLEDWFVEKGERKEAVYGFDDPANQPISLNLVSTRANTSSTGSIQIKLGFAPTTNSNNLMRFDEIYSELVKRSRPFVVSALPVSPIAILITEGVGTIRSNQIGGVQYEDDGGRSSDSDDSDDEAEYVDASDTTPPSSASSSPKQILDIYIPPGDSSDSEAKAAPAKPDGPLPELTIQPSSPATPTPGGLPTPIAVEPTPKTSTGFTVKTPTSAMFIPKKFIRKFSGLIESSTSSTPGDSPSSPAITSATSPAVDSHGNLIAPIPESGNVKKRSASRERIKFGRSWSSRNVNAAAGAAASSPSSGATTPSEQSGTGLAPTPSPSTAAAPVAGAEGAKIGIRTSFKTQLNILDWDKLSSNDHIDDASLDAKELLANAPQPDPVTSLYAAGEEEGGGEKGMREFSLSLSTAKETSQEGKHNPVTQFRAKYQSYDALRQRFWRQYLTQYDTDDTGALSHLELTSMLDLLGSTLTGSIISSFFTRYGKKPHENETSIEQAVLCHPGRPSQMFVTASFDAR